MKKFAILLLFIMLAFTFVNAQTVAELKSQLEASNQMLIVAIDKIDALNAEIKTLKSEKENLTKDVITLRDRLHESTLQLIDSNATLQKALERIEKDEKEIARLRELLDKAIAALESQRGYYTVSAAASYTFTESFGGGLFFETEISKTPFSILTGVEYDGKIKVIAGIGYKLK